jgi:hypothetical protein
MKANPFVGSSPRVYTGTENSGHLSPGRSEQPRPELISMEGFVPLCPRCASIHPVADGAAHGFFPNRQLLMCFPPDEAPVTRKWILTEAAPPAERPLPCRSKSGRETQHNLGGQCLYIGI